MGDFASGGIHSARNDQIGIDQKCPDSTGDGGAGDIREVCRGFFVCPAGFHSVDLFTDKSVLMFFNDSKSLVPKLFQVER